MQRSVDSKNVAELARLAGGLRELIELRRLGTKVITDGLRDCRHVIRPGTLLGARNRPVATDVAGADPPVVKYQGLWPLAVQHLRQRRALHAPRFGGRIV